MLKKMATVILTSVLVSGFLTYWSYTPMSERADDTMYESASGIFILHMIYALPIILISGFLTDFLVKNGFKGFSSVRLTVVFQAFLYMLSGVIIGIILILQFTKDDSNIPISLLIAGSSALLYFIVSRLIERTWRHPA
ncbi:hypothetical protein [Exiguobacterium artemiae]